MTALGRFSILLFLYLVAHASGCTHYEIRQSSLVPAATLPPAPSSRGHADVYIEDTTVTYLSYPERAPSSDAGLWIPRHQFQGALSLHVSDHLSLRLLGLDGLSAGAIKAAPSTLRNPGSDMWAWGYGSTVSLKPFGDRHELHVSFGMFWVGVPCYREVTCDDEDCGSEPYLEKAVEYEKAAVTYGSLVYAYGFSQRLDLLVTAAFRNHLTNQESFSSSHPGADIDVGPAYLTVGIGTEIRLYDFFSLVPYVQWPLNRDPVIYGPIVGFGLRGTLPDRN